MPVVHVMTGLPASGKTTAARKLQAESEGRIRRVNLDDLRMMLDIPAPERGRSHTHEQTVLAIQDAAVRAAVDGGFDVVVDNTHMTPHIPKRLKAAVGGQATFVVHDFTDVPVEECVRRDAERDRPVGEEIIRLLADKHTKSRRGGWRLTAEWLNDEPSVEPYTADPALPSAVMCDIDGTPALRGDRGAYDSRAARRTCSTCRCAGRCAPSAAPTAMSSSCSPAAVRSTAHVRRRGFARTRFRTTNCGCVPPVTAAATTW